MPKLTFAARQALSRCEGQIVVAAKCLLADLVRSLKQRPRIRPPLQVEVDGGQVVGGGCDDDRLRGDLGQRNRLLEQRRGRGEFALFLELEGAVVEVLPRFHAGLRLDSPGLHARPAGHNTGKSGNGDDDCCWPGDDSRRSELIQDALNEPDDEQERDEDHKPDDLSYELHGGDLLPFLVPLWRFTAASLLRGQFQAQSQRGLEIGLSACLERANAGARGFESSSMPRVPALAGLGLPPNPRLPALAGNSLQPGACLAKMLNCAGLDPGAQPGPHRGPPGSSAARCPAAWQPWQCRDRGTRGAGWVRRQAQAARCPCAMLPRP